MSTMVRTTILAVLASSVVLMTAMPASAARIIGYRGESSQDLPVSLSVLKKQDGRRSVRGFEIYFTTSCQGSEELLGFRFDRRRVSEDGSFHYAFRNEDLFAYSVYVDGTVRFGSAEGTFEFNYPTLTDDDQALLCTTGTLNWSADRGRSMPARTAGSHRDEPEGPSLSPELRLAPQTARPRGWAAAT